jgi:hypothetical protein
MSSGSRREAAFLLSPDETTSAIKRREYTTEININSGIWCHLKGEALYCDVELKSLSVEMEMDEADALLCQL